MNLEINHLSTHPAQEPNYNTPGQLSSSSGIIWLYKCLISSTGRAESVFPMAGKEPPWKEPTLNQFA